MTLRHSAKTAAHKSAGTAAPKEGASELNEAHRAALALGERQLDGEEAPDMVEFNRETQEEMQQLAFDLFDVDRALKEAGHSLVSLLVKTAQDAYGVDVRPVPLSPPSDA